MRGDAKWFDDTVAVWETATRLEHAMFDMGLDVRHDAGFAAWFRFNEPETVRAIAFPVWMHKTFQDYGGYQAYLRECEG